MKAGSLAAAAMLLAAAACSAAGKPADSDDDPATRDDREVLEATVRFVSDSTEGPIEWDPRLFVANNEGAPLNSSDFTNMTPEERSGRVAVLEEAGITLTEDPVGGLCPGHQVGAILPEMRVNCPDSAVTRIVMGPTYPVSSYAREHTEAPGAKFALVAITTLTPLGKEYRAFEFVFAKDAEGDWSVQHRHPLPTPHEPNP